jgi:hypothetical protein
MGVLFSVYRFQEITEKISIIYPTDRFAFPCTFTKSPARGAVIETHEQAGDLKEW